MLPIIEGVIAPLTAGVQNVAGWLKQAKSTTGGWMDYVNIIKGYFMNSIVPLVTKVWDVVSSMVGKLFEFVSKSELLKDIFSGIAKLAGFIADYIGWMIDNLKWVFDNVVMPILNGIEKAYRWIKGSDPEPDNDSGGTPIPIYMPSPQQKKEQQTTQDLLTNIAENTATNASAAKRNESTISGGGQKVVNISVAKFLDSINLTTMNMQEGSAEIEKIFLEMFSRVLVQGGQ